MSEVLPLKGRVALVAGATRGAGRGIALALAEAGATVHVSGRSSRSQQRPPRGADVSPFELSERPETIEETAELVSARGGVGVAHVVDHTDRERVAALVQDIERQSGRLDVLVNDVWGGDALAEWGTPAWQLDVDKGWTMIERGIRTHLITARAALPLLLASDRGLLVEITDGDTFAYRGTLFYDLVKTTLIRLAFSLSEELRETRVTALSLTPGFLRSEAMLEHFGVKADTWREGARKDPHFAESETPLFVGRAVAALASDERVARHRGRALSSWALSEEYGFVDDDGRRPHWGRHAASESFGVGQAESHRRFVDQLGR
jgi:NAD(P)-dependent dehydrogenase (short-subunit alcohol dehydrogenase family)